MRRMEFTAKDLAEIKGKYGEILDGEMTFNALIGDDAIEKIITNDLYGHYAEIIPNTLEHVEYRNGENTYKFKYKYILK